MSTGFDELLWAVTNYDPEHPDYEELSDIGDGQYLASAAADLIQELRRGLAAAQAEIECEERRFSEQQDLLHSVIQERDAAQAEARELRAGLARVKTLSATWREQAQALAEQQATECDPDIASVLEATGDQLETCAEELDAALSPAPEPILSTCPVCGDPDDHEHDSMVAPAPELPLMARDTCTNCGGTGVGGYHVHAPQEDAVEALRCEACDGFGYTPAAQESGDA